MCLVVGFFFCVLCFENFFLSFYCSFLFFLLRKAPVRGAEIFGIFLIKFCFYFLLTALLKLKPVFFCLIFHEWRSSVV